MTVAPERRAERCSRAAASRWLGLRRVWRPAGQEHDLECLVGPATIVGCASESRGGPSHRRRHERLALGQDITRPHSAQITEQPAEIAVPDVERFYIGDGQGKPCAHQQVAGGSHVDLRVEARGWPLAFRGPQCAAKCRQTPRTDERAEKQAVRAEHAANQGQRAGQVVDLIEYARAHHEIERGIGEGETILVSLHAAWLGSKREPRIAAGHAGARRRGEGAVEAAEIEDVGKVSRHCIQPFGDSVEHRGPQEVVAGIARRGTVPANTARGAVEDLGGGVF